MARRSEHSAAAVSERLLGATIVAAPLAAGGFRLQVLPVLATLAILAYVTTLYASRRAHRPLHLGVLVVGLFVLGVFTMLQAIPLPEGLLAVLSPRAAEVRSFVGAGPGGPITYEVGATWREAAKLFLYTIVAIVAFERCRATKSLRIVAYPVVIAGLATALIAVIHRALGIERLFGLIEARGGSTSQMLTTFVNPNHAAGFMALAALTSVGLALDEEHRPRRIGLIAVAGLFAAVSVLVLSKGGVVALVLGVGVFGVAAFSRRRSLGAATPALVGTLLAVPIAGVLWRADAVIAEFTDERTFGLDEKLAAMRDAIPLVLDHTWLGVGRGAYVSVYTAYKTSPLQLTFAFPENLAAQLASEWGLVFGAAALLGLITAIVFRVMRAPSWTALGASCGVFAVAVQNAVDFSLEMPGVAVLVAALVAGAGSKFVSTRRIGLQTSGAVVAAVPVVLLVASIAFAFRGGDLFDDLAAIDERPREVLLARHPASALIAARLAYRAEQAEPPDLAVAIRLANRAMYLAPTYADGHTLAGRLLVRGGHRRQGFGELRRAWALSPSARGPLIDQVIALARSPAEVLRAVPRRDEALDIVDEREAARVVTRLVEKKKPEWGRAVLASLAPIDELDAEGLTTLALAATRTGTAAYARKILARRLEVTPQDTAARIVLARSWMTERDFTRATKVLAGVEVTEDNAKEVWSLRYRLAMASKDFDAGRKALDELDARVGPTLAGQARLANQRADLERAAGRRGKALEALDAVLARNPSDVSLRMKRAIILFEEGRRSEARVDAEFVLRRQPDHVGAKRLVERTR